MFDKVNKCQFMQFLTFPQQYQQANRNFLMRGFITHLCNEVYRDPHYQMQQLNTEAIVFTEAINPEELPFHLQWNLVSINQNYQLVVCPFYLEAYGTTLKANNYSTVNDFLKRLIKLNSEQPYWKAFLNHSHQIQLVHPLSHTYFQKHNYAQWWFKIKHAAHQLFHKISLILSPFTLEPLPKVNENHMVVEKEKTWKNLEFLFMEMISSEVQIEIMTQVEKNKENKDYLTQFFGNKTKRKKLLMDARQKSISKHSQMLKFLGIGSNPSWNKAISSYNSFSINQNPQHENLPTYFKRNVHGVQFVNISSEKQVLEAGDPTHCKIQKGIFQLILMETVNQETNKVFEDYASKNMENMNVDRKKKSVQLVVKTPQNKIAKSVVNSFQTEINFINFIRNLRGCEHIATFYMELSKESTVDRKSFMMDYYPQNLNQFNKNNQGSLVEKLKILQQVIQGLKWLSKYDICHRDIKPQNIMVDVNKKAKIIDFGNCCPNLKGQNYRGGFKAKTNQFLGTKKYYPSFKQYSSLLHTKVQGNQYYKKRQEYRQHPLLDVYSFGKVMESLLDHDLQGLPEVGEFLRYIWNRCTSVVPQDWPDFQTLDSVLGKIIEFCYIKFETKEI